MRERVDNRAQPVLGGRLPRTGRELPENMPVAGTTETGQKLHVHRRSARRGCVFGLKIRDFDFQPVSAREYGPLSADGSQVGMRMKLLHGEILEDFTQGAAPTRVGEIIQTPVRIQHGDAIGFETRARLGFEHRQIDGNFGVSRRCLSRGQQINCRRGSLAVEQRARACGGTKSGK